MKYDECVETMQSITSLVIPVASTPERGRGAVGLMCRLIRQDRAKEGSADHGKRMIGCGKP